MRIASILPALLFCTTLSAQQPKLVLPVGHTGNVTVCSFSADGKYIVTGSQDQTACIWNAETGQMLHHLKGHTSGINEAAFTNDGTKIMTRSYTGEVRIWNALTGDSIWLFLAGSKNAKNNFASFSPNGNSLLMSLNDTLAQIRDLKTGETIRVFRNNESTIEDGSFSPDGTKIITRSGNNTARIWETGGASILQTLSLRFDDYFKMVRFSNDGKKILSNTRKDSAIVWDAETGKRKAAFLQKIDNRTEGFSADGQRILHVLPDNRIALINVETKAQVVLSDSKNILTRILLSADGKKLSAFSKNSNQVLVYNLEKEVPPTSFIVEFSVTGQLCFSPNGMHLVTTSGKEIKNWDLTKDGEQEPAPLTGLFVSEHPFFFTKDGKHFFSNSEERGPEIWETNTGKPLLSIEALKEEVSDVLSATGGDGVYTQIKDDTLIWDVLQKRPLFIVPDTTATQLDLSFSKDRSLAVSTLNEQPMAAIWELRTGAIVHQLALGYKKLEAAVFTKDNRYLLTLKRGGHEFVEIWNTLTGDSLHWLGNGKDVIKAFAVSDSGYRVALGSPKGIISVWDAVKGTELWRKKFDEFSTSNYLLFSPDNQWLLAGSSGGGILRLINAATGEEKWKDQNIDPAYIHPSIFSPDGQQFYTFSNNSSFSKRELLTGKPLTNIDLGTYKPEDYNYASNLLLVSNNSGEKQLISLDSNRKLYSFYAIDSAEYLVTDNYGRYDGTKKARNLLYLVCGLEVIGLEQVKDQLWVPNLAKRIMNQEAINEPRLSDLNICSNVPVVELKESTADGYRFLITPRKGGLGNVYVSVNGIETLKFDPSELIADGNRFILEIGRSIFLDSQGGTSELSVKAMNADNLISSAEVVIRKESAHTPAVTPNLYAVFIGVSEYKARSLNLQFAAKDADNLGDVFAAAARKFLNTKTGEDHVILHKLNTGTNRTGYPDKATIQKTLEDIGSKATPNDILVIFFAGHGKMLSENLQFYFLTADTDSTTVESIMKGGISMDTLTSWVNPSHIKAQKRILIFDACNSGQAINNFIANGAAEQRTTAVSGELESKQIKAIEKFYDRSNFFILSASANDQSAYEYEALAHGLLTYSLLNSIKINGAILNKQNFIDVDRWFSASNEFLTELVKQNKLRQEPQQLGNNTNTFSVGKVDEEVKNLVKLPEIRPTFGKCDFRNTAFRRDDLNMEEAVYEALNNAASTGSPSLIFFNKENTGRDIYSLSCDYTVTNDKIMADVILFKEGKLFASYKTEGTDFKKLCRDLVDTAIGLATGLNN